MSYPISTSLPRLSRREFLKLAGLSVSAMALFNGCTGQPESSMDQDVSLDVKIGQLLMVGFRGFKVSEDHPIVHDIRDRHLGGVVLFDYDVPTKTAVRNIESPAQVKALVEALQSFSDTPLLVAVDHEGGIITRLKEALSPD